MYIAIDFDGTVVEHLFPSMGDEVPYAVEVMKKLVERGDLLLLNTMRSGVHLDEAVEWYNDRCVPLYGIGKNPTQSLWTKSPKCYAHVYIDDAALGCPLIRPEGRRPYVDWKKIAEMLEV